MIEQNFPLGNIQQIEIVELEFEANVKNAIKQFQNDNDQLLYNGDDDEITKRLYYLYKELKNTDFSKTKFSYKFFDDLYKVIKNSLELNKKNFENNFRKFFLILDKLFEKEVSKEKEYKKIEKQEKLENKKFIEQIIRNKIEETRKNIINMYLNIEKKILNLIDD